VRARAGAPVAVPLRWDELGRVRSARRYTLHTVFRRLARVPDPWGDVESAAKGSLELALDKLHTLTGDGSSASVT
jgi:bifunctional non-homologous end joining protein LigD